MSVSNWRFDPRLGWGIIAGVIIGLLAGVVVYGLGIERARNKPWRDIAPDKLRQSLASAWTLQKGANEHTLLIFMDYTCGGCRGVIPLMVAYPAVVQKGVSIKLVRYPLSRLGRGWEAAEAMQIAEQKGFGTIMHDYLMSTEPDKWDFEKWASQYQMSGFSSRFKDAANLAKIKAVVAECEASGLMQSPSMALMDSSGRIALSPNVRAMWKRLDEL